MQSHRQLLAEIAAAAGGPQIAALFDMDRTLIAGFSAQDVVVERVQAGGVSLPQLLGGVATAVEYGIGRIPFVEFVNRAAAALGARKIMRSARRCSETASRDASILRRVN
jgi:phosphoserine phosphatase